MIKETTMISRDSKGKIRVLTLNYGDYGDIAYIIGGESGLYGGKMTPRPNKVITEGKVKRTTLEQTELEYNALVKKQFDKGYKLLEKPLNEYDEQSLQKLLGNAKTDANGAKKPMLAKQIDKVKTEYIEKHKWYISRKIDGTRCMFSWDGNKIKTASRGGGDYDLVTTFFRENQKFIDFFKKHPNYILDGELYKHGKSLQQISGAVRLEKTADGMDWIEYYIYDIIMEDKPFEDRLKILNEIKEELCLDFQPNREWEKDDLRIQMVPQVKVVGYNTIKNFHDDYVKEGFEGAVIRDPKKCYKCGGRGNEMLKVKCFQDAEYEIVNISEGLRDEDMCFILKTADGKEFKAKPMGSREVKEKYRRDLNKIIGKMATIKYFYLSDDGIPLLPVFKVIRDYE